MWQRLLTLLAACRRPLVVVDFETSGLDGAPPVEYAVAVWAPWQASSDDPTTLLASRSCPAGLTYAATGRLNPGGPIHPAAQRVHGISEEDVRGALAWNDLGLRAVFRGLAEGDPAAEGGPEGAAVWTGHNAAESDVPWSQMWGYLPHDPVPAVIDTMRLVRRLAKDHPFPIQPDAVRHLKCPAVGHGLEPYAKSLIGLHTALFGDPPEVSHGALADVLSTARCLEVMLELWAPLWPAQVRDEDPDIALAAMLAALDQPPLGALSWDGWLAEDRDTGAITWSGKAKKPNKGAPLTKDRSYAQWVMSLPPTPTGRNGEAWCSDATRSQITAALSGTTPAPPKRIGHTVDLTRTP